MRAINLPAGKLVARVRPLSELAQRAAFWVVRLRWPYRPGVLDTAWAVFSVVNLLAILRFESWETIPFHFIWISFTLLYGFRTWSARPTTIVLAVVMVTTAAGIGLDVIRGTEPKEELTEVPLMAAMFVAMVWHARRKLAAEHEYHLVSEQNARLLTNQRRFLQDASHQLRTPITIALGHAELLGSTVTGQQDARDVEVILGELNRLRHISDRLLVIAAADDPEFLRLVPVALDRLTMEIIRRWRPTASRQWRLGQLDEVSVFADAERLELAVDALLENAVRHTGTGDVIKLSVVKGWAGEPVRMTVTDSGSGIPADRLDRIFERFSTSNDGTSRGTGLGLALVRAVARAHGGEVRVSSTVGEGSEFELLLPGVPTTPELPADGMPAEEAAGQPDGRMAEEERGSITR